MKYSPIYFLIALLLTVVGCDLITKSDGDLPSLECKDGTSEGKYPCKNIDLVGYVDPYDLLGTPLNGKILNDIWGWTDPETGTEYAIVGLNDGVSFVDISIPSEPVVVGKLNESAGISESGKEKSQGNTHNYKGATTWRDFKVYKDHLFVVSDAQPHGLQVFDLSRLQDVEDPPEMFSEDLLYEKFTNAHNIAINEETGYAYVVGSTGGGQTCGGGLHMVNIHDPLNPTFAGCFTDPSTGRRGTGYTHDVQCVTYHGPDFEYTGREICFGANETAISIADVTDKENPKAISTASYPDHAYVHQGWLTEDHRYFFQNDELDEFGGNQTRTLIWDMSDLNDPQFVRAFTRDNTATDHNLYIKGNMMYQSNYKSGIQVFDISDPANPEEVGSFDTFPFEKNDPGFDGTWSNYPFFESGIIVVSDISHGLFILKPSYEGN